MLSLLYKICCYDPTETIIKDFLGVLLPKSFPASLSEIVPRFRMFLLEFLIIGSGVLVGIFFSIVFLAKPPGMTYKTPSKILKKSRRNLVKKSRQELTEKRITGASRKFNEKLSKASQEIRGQNPSDVLENSLREFSRRTSAKISQICKNSWKNYRNAIPLTGIPQENLYIFWQNLRKKSSEEFSKHIEKTSERKHGRYSCRDSVKCSCRNPGKISGKIPGTTLINRGRNTGKIHQKHLFR